MFNEQKLIQHLNDGLTINPQHDNDLFETVIAIGNANRTLTQKMNTSQVSDNDIRIIMEKITGKKIDKDFRLFPPFYTDFGRNIHLGKRVFINASAHFQDQGGIYIGDDCFIGHSVVIATINHPLIPEERSTLIPQSVHLGKGVWVGSHTTILPGIHIGDNAVIGAGSVVTKDVPARNVVAGNPARVIHQTLE
ncbi:sugar O-acetyltransferase [Alloscardovia theropitheci]|uniref:Sugar O-acetyltransferase n=1 Tax=Alloscardovia theropitheci TaxID=2496842 RepID=A0A4R0QPY5_9BIFI|nr:DapH/DapD/GlmU-related protein [Alloscardovia theropitheci]TCD54324.1 sugar O-acetyltransferase [Alloscardovia theropitheci]